jgi:hypothetical protein
MNDTRILTMKRFTKSTLIGFSRVPGNPLVITVILFASILALPAGILYQNNFEQAETGKAPDDFLILEGGFAVKQEPGNRFLELPGSPLDSFAALFGPTESSNLVVSAAINGTAKGRRFPTFGVGLNGVAGYKLQVSPAKNVLEIFRDQQSKTNIHLDWKSGEWIMLKLQVRSLKAGTWRIEGKAWPKGGNEPDSWILTLDDQEPPPSGRPSVFGSPFAGTAIQFDDLTVRTTAP